MNWLWLIDKKVLLFSLPWSSAPTETISVQKKFLPKICLQQSGLTLSPKRSGAVAVLAFSSSLKKQFSVRRKLTPKPCLQQCRSTLTHRRSGAVAFSLVCSARSDPLLIISLSSETTFLELSRLCPHAHARQSLHSVFRPRSFSHKETGDSSWCRSSFWSRLFTLTFEVPSRLYYTIFIKYCTNHYSYVF